MRTSTRFIVVGIVLPLLIGCGSGSSGTPGGGGLDPLTGGMLRISVKDDPFPIDCVLEASVDVGRVEAHDQDSDAWIVLSEELFTINLVGLTNGIVEEIIDVAVDPGTYDQFRFITGPGRVVLDPAKAHVDDEGRLEEDLVIETPTGPIVTDGYVFTVDDGGVKFPSGPQTGIKVHVDPPIVVSTQLSGELELDFDLGQNFVLNGPVSHAPGVKRVLFTPSVQATNASTAGSVMVTIHSDEALLLDPSDDLPLEDAEVWLVDGAAAKVANAFTDATGMATIKAPPGTYTLHADKFGFLGNQVPNVEIVLANLEDEGTLVLEPSSLVITGVVYSDAGTPGTTAPDTDDDYVIGGVLATLDLTTPAHSDSTTTEGDGLFTFERLEEATYDLNFSKTGFDDYPTTWAPAGGPMDVRLHAQAQEVIATVEDVNQTGVSGASVTATDANGNTWMATTNTSGQASLTLPTGTYTFTATASGGGAFAAAASLPVDGDDDAATSDAVTLTPVTP